jgi:HPt (histidine-containing phosphotransfer) domain-containing protein
MIDSKDVHPEDFSQSSGGVALFDRAELLENFEGDEEMLQSIAEDAITEIPKEVAGLQSACSADDCTTTIRSAHTIKGMAANICTPALRDIAAKIETAAKEGDLDSARSLLPELEHTAYMTVEAIRG